MPGFNKKGPQGEGSMTGRGLGRCNPENKTRFPENTTNTSEESEAKQINPLAGRGLGLRRGRGAGFGFRRKGC